MTYQDNRTLIGIENLLSPIGIDTFQNKYWEKSPLLVHRSHPFYYGLPKLADVDSLLLYGCPTEAKRDVIASKVPLGSKKETKYYLDAFDRDYWAKLTNLYASGHTILLNQMHLRHPSVLALVKDVEAFAGAYTYANMFVSPDSCESGFPIHCDAQELFVLQLEGKKRWQVFEPQYPLPHTALPNALVDTDALSPVMEVELEPGDVLYLPRGFIHRVLGVGGPALHLSLGVEPVRAMDLLLEALLIASRNDIAFRRSVRALGSFANRDAAREIFCDLLERFASKADFDSAIDGVLSNVIAKSVPSPNGYFGRVSSKIEADTPLQLKPQLLCAVTTHITPRGERMTTLRYSGNALAVEPDQIAAIRFILDRKDFTPAQLPLEADAKSRAEFANNLTVQGFVCHANVGRAKRSNEDTHQTITGRSQP